MRKFINKIITILMIILIILVTYIGLSFYNKNKITKAKFSQSPKITQQETNDKVDKWQSQVQIIKNELQKQNELIVLEGTQEIQKTFSTTDNEIKLQSKSSILKWMANKLNELKTKSITVNTTYKYYFVYDISKISINTEDNKINIIINEGDINLKLLSELSDKRIITDDEGILAKFIPQEVSSVMYSTQIHTYNTLVNDSELYDKAVQNTKDDLMDLINKLGIKNKDINFQVIHNNTIKNNEVDEIN